MRRSIYFPLPKNDPYFDNKNLHFRAKGSFATDSWSVKRRRIKAGFLQDREHSNITSPSGSWSFTNKELCDLIKRSFEPKPEASAALYGQYAKAMELVAEPKAREKAGKAAASKPGAPEPR